MNIKISQIAFNNPVFLIKGLKKLYTLQPAANGISLTLYDLATLEEQQQIQLKHLSACNFHLTADGKNLFFMYQAKEKVNLIKRQIDNGAEETVWEGDIEDFFISQTGKFAAIKNRQRDFILINTETKTLLQELGLCSKIEFLPDEHYCFAGYPHLLSRINLLSNQIEDFSRLNLEHFAMDTTGKLMVLWWDSYFEGQFSIRQIETGVSFTRMTDKLEAIVHAEFISATRLLLVTRKNPRIYSLINADNQTGFDLTLYELNSNKTLHLATLEKISQLSINASDNEIIISIDNLIKIINIPQPDSLRQYFAMSNHQGEEYVLEKIELLRIAHQAVQEVLKKTSKNIKRINNDFLIESAQDWLATAGHLSCYALGNFDKRYDLPKNPEAKWFPAYFKIGSSDYRVEVKNIRSDAYVSFSMCKNGSYFAIDEYLRQFTSVPDPTEEQIKQLFESGFQQLLPSNKKHVELANILLKKIAGEDYPAELNVHLKQLLDALLVLMLGVETSRNNTTFLTTIMLMDLIAARATFGSHHHAYSWDNAFVSTAGYEWEDYETNNCGGKFPMATFSTGSGNMKERRDAVKDNINVDDIFIDKQRHRVEEREMNLISNWLKYIRQTNPDYFENIKSLNELKSSIKNIFSARLCQVYGIQPIADLPLLLPTKESGIYSRTPWRLHYEREPYLLYFKHQSTDQNGKATVKIGKYYHRTDYPCKTLPGFVIKRTSKNIKEMKLSTQVFVEKKMRFYLWRENRDYEDLLKKINTLPVTQIKKEKYQIFLNKFNQWCLDYLGADTLLYDGLSKQLLSFKLRHIDSWQNSDRLIPEIIKNLKWEKINDNPDRRRISANQIEKIIRDNTELKKFFLEKDRKTLNFNLLREYSDKFLDRLQQVFDPLMENGAKAAVNLHILFGTPEQRHEIILGLLREQNWYTTETEDASFLSYLLFYYGMSNIGMEFYRLDGNKLSACSYCYSHYSEPYPALPYNYQNAVCLMTNNSDFYHRIDSHCSHVTYNANDRKFFLESQEQINEAINTFVLTAEKEGKKPCHDCWWPLDNQIIQREHTKKRKAEAYPVDTPNEKRSKKKSELKQKPTNALGFFENGFSIISKPNHVIPTLEVLDLPTEKNLAVQIFLGDNTDKNPSHLKFDTWYHPEVCHYLLQLVTNQAKCLRVIFSDAGYGNNTQTFKDQLQQLVMLGNSLQQHVIFISKEPGADNHYICGLVKQDKLLLINPLGITKKSDCYQTLAELKKEKTLSEIWLSSNPIQRTDYEENSLVSCGPISIELAIHILSQFTSEELNNFWQQLKTNEPITHEKSGLIYFGLNIENLLPSTLKLLIQSPDRISYQIQTCTIRKNHLELLKTFTNNQAKARNISVNDYLKNIKCEAPAQVIFDALITKHKNIDNINELPEYQMLEQEISNEKIFVNNTNQIKNNTV